MKRNISKTGRNQSFRKNVKTCLQNKKTLSDVAFKTWPFSSDFNFACNDGRVTAETCKYYCLKVLPLPTVARISVLNMAGVPKSVFENIRHVQKLVQFLLFRNVATFIESHCVSLCYFLQYDQVFLISILQGCYHYLVFMDPGSGCSKSNYL